MTTSGTTHTTMTTLDNASSTGDDSHDNFACDSSIISQSSARSSSRVTECSTPVPLEEGQINHKIYIYQYLKFIDYVHTTTEKSEHACIHFCRWLNITPIARLLFGLCVHDAPDNWIPPGDCLQEGVRYALRIRYKVPSLETNLSVLDPNAFTYLYYQMRMDMVNETIKEIRYPQQKDKVTGLSVVDMYIDLLEQRDGNRDEIIKKIERDYKKYLPKRLLKAHPKIFVKPKIRESFNELRKRVFTPTCLRQSYVQQVHNLAPDYLMERYKADVEYIPSEMEHTEAHYGLMPNGNVEMTRVFVKLDLFDETKPSINVARITDEDKLKWHHLTHLDSIYTLCVEKDTYTVRIEIIEFRQGYRMKFVSRTQLDSFITYLTGYFRLTTKWMEDLCIDYITPSLKELLDFQCHGPIGGNFSFTKLRVNHSKCSNYLVRQCEKEYDVYFIDINIKSRFNDNYKTETYKIERKIEENLNGEQHIKWLLHFNDSQLVFDNLHALAQHIPTNSEQRQCIHPSKYDKPPLLLICLPKNLQSKKTDQELSENELQRRRPQIFVPKHDLQWYREKAKVCDNGKMSRIRADWKQEGSYKDVCVTLKVLQNDKDFQEFMILAHTWSKVSSPHLIKLYGLTLSTPYTMVMEYAEYGALNEFLQKKQNQINFNMLLMAIENLIRGIIYLREQDIVHDYIRCCNLYVTRYNPKERILQTKIGDPGFPRPYRTDDLPWIPLEYHKNMEAAKKDAGAEAWAFGTTVWEIITHGMPLPKNLTSDNLHSNFRREGAILTIPDECPHELCTIIMDGWNKNSEKRFDHHHIFRRLRILEEKSSNAYEYFPMQDNSSYTKSDTSSLSHDFSDNSYNGHSEFSNVGMSTTDISPLISNAWHHNHHHHPASYPTSRSYFEETPSVLEISCGKVIYKKKIGEGHYGTVYLGELRYNTHGENRRVEQVAIKTLKTQKAQLDEDFMREIQIMLALDHPNIVKIKHWVKDPISIIMEYVECGCFLAHLKAHKPNLTNKTLMDFALDIALGMEYLCEQKIIHRDLAARNILVDCDRAKISDFGLAQQADSEGYYLAHSLRELPIKWYSPESIRTNKFSFQSDVWSYGVTLFEMFSRGEIPNLNPQRELTQEEFLNHLEQGVTLPKPELCPNNVYADLMKPCWHLNPKMRPDFKAIKEKVQLIATEFVV